MIPMDDSGGCGMSVLGSLQSTTVTCAGDKLICTMQS